MILILRQIILCLVVAIGLSEVYRKFLSNLFVWSDLFTIFIANGSIAIVLVAYYKFRNQEFISLRPSRSRKELVESILPSVTIIVFLALTSGISFVIDSRVNGVFQAPYLVSIFLVPLVEEIVFRGSVSKLFSYRSNPYLAMYFSALTFSLCHTLPTVSNLSEFSLMVPLGPFLLGLICEYLVLKYRSLFPAILFHMSCNFTAAYFYWFDQRWLDWLNIFYN